MKGYEIKFNIYADSEEEAAEAQKAIIGFISQHAKDGRAVTGRKIVNALSSWDKNMFVRHQVINYLK